MPDLILHKSYRKRSNRRAAGGTRSSNISNISNIRNIRNISSSNDMTNQQKRNNMNMETSLVGSSSSFKNDDDDNDETSSRKRSNKTNTATTNKNNRSRSIEQWIKIMFLSNTSTRTSTSNSRSNSKKKLISIGILVIATTSFLVVSSENQLVVDPNKVGASVSVSTVASAIIPTDYSDITGIDDLELRSKRISELCYSGMENECQCENPMIGKGRQGQRHWLKTSRENSDSIATIKDTDVVFYGDSITEGWKGTSYGFDNGRKAGNIQVFESLFSTKRGGKYEGVAMGISGDRSPDLLWRLQNSEMPQSLNPQVIWLLIGTNDMGWAWCKPEVALIGILRVVEEIRAKKPGCDLVINGLLPRSFDHQTGYLMKKGYNTKKQGSKKLPSLWNDIQAINKQLEEYSKGHDNVHYVDASDIFLVDEFVKEDELQIDVNLMNDYLHPSDVGYKVWGDRIVEKLDELLKEDR